MIFWDPRVGSRRKGQRASHELVAKALVDLGVTVEPLSLDYGDFMFLGHGPDGPMQVGVELKTVQDFVSSMVSGRLAGHQIPGLTERYQRIYVVIEGVYRIGRRSGLIEVPRGKGWRPVSGPRPIFWADVEKFITGLEEVGVRVRRTRSSHETARVIRDVLDSFWSKDYEEHASFNVLYRPAPMALVREDPIVRRVRQVAACLPSIGWTRSKTVAEKFGSIQAIANSEESDWLSIDGIGESIAHQAVESLRAQISHGETRRVPARSRKTSKVPARVHKASPRKSKAKQANGR